MTTRRSRLATRRSRLATGRSRRVIVLLAARRIAGGARNPQIAIGAVGHALVVALMLVCAAPSAHAAEHRYRAVHISGRTATFAIGSLAGQIVVSAHLDATGAKSRPVGVATVRRASGGSRRLRLTLPRSWRSAHSAGRKHLTLHIHTRRRPEQAPSAYSPLATPLAVTAAARKPLVGSVAAPAPVLWKADAESTMASEWASSSSIPAAAAPPNPDPSRIAQSTFRAQGLRSYRFEMRAGDNSYGARAELGQALPARTGFENRWFYAGEERWIALQYYLPSDWPTADTWQTILQIKPVSPGGGGPSVGLDVGRNKLMVYGNSNAWGSTAGNIFDGAGSLSGGAYPLPRGRWIKLTWHVVFSADPAVGALEVFGDLGDGSGMRTLVPRRTRATLKYRLDGTVDPAHLRVGIYRDPTITATASMYVDGITVASTRAGAEAAAYAML